MSCLFLKQTSNIPIDYKNLCKYNTMLSDAQNVIFFWAVTVGTLIFDRKKKIITADFWPN